MSDDAEREQEANDAAYDGRSAKREALCRQMCALMGWEYSTGPVYAGIRAVAKAEAIPISLEKLDQVAAKLVNLSQWKESALPLLNDWSAIGESVPGKLGSSMVDNVKNELGRLTAALHAAKAHPDYGYVVVPPQASAQMREMFSSLGWEQCPEAATVPGDRCLRRKKSAKPEA